MVTTVPAPSAVILKYLLLISTKTQMNPKTLLQALWGSMMATASNPHIRVEMQRDLQAVEQICRQATLPWWQGGEWPYTAAQHRHCTLFWMVSQQEHSLPKNVRLAWLTATRQSSFLRYSPASGISRSDASVWRHFAYAPSNVARY